MPDCTIYMQSAGIALIEDYVRPAPKRNVAPALLANSLISMSAPGRRGALT